MGEAELARFIDRFTVEYIRVYAHPIERVWRSITDPVEFRKWFIPGSIELRAGSAYRFETGDDGFKGVVLEVEAPRLIRFGGPSDERGYFQYELAQAPGGTRMRFIQHFPSGGVYTEVPDYLGGDLPAGPGTPWKPGFVGGWHEFWDALADHLDGVPVGSRLPPTEFGAIAAAWVMQAKAHGLTAEQGVRMVRGLRRQERWNELNKVYRAHIKATCPPAEGVRERAMALGWFEVSLDVQDIERSLAFYEKLGFQLVDGSVAFRNVTLQKADCRISLYQGYLDPPQTQLIFWQGDIHAIARDLTGKGLSFERGPAKGDDGGTAAMLKDPDGHPIINMPHVVRKGPA